MQLLLPTDIAKQELEKLFTKYFITERGAATFVYSTVYPEQVCTVLSFADERELEKATDNQAYFVPFEFDNLYYLVVPAAPWPLTFEHITLDEMEVIQQMKVFYEYYLFTKYHELEPAKANGH